MNCLVGHCPTKTSVTQPCRGHRKLIYTVQSKQTRDKLAYGGDGLGKRHNAPGAPKEKARGKAQHLL